jgi:hypothetical protein
MVVQGEAPRPVRLLLGCLGFAVPAGLRRWRPRLTFGWDVHCRKLLGAVDDRLGQFG